MKKIILMGVSIAVLIVLAVLLLSFSGCSKQTPIPAEKEQAPEQTIPQQVSVNPQVEKYFDYFSANNHVLMLFEHEAGTDFTDEEICAYSISVAIDEAQDDGFDFKNGISKEQFDAITSKYFGKTVSSYINKKTTTTESGGIVATGWSPSSYDFVLKEMESTDEGIVKAAFYKVQSPMGIESQDELDNITERMLVGDFEGMGDVYLVEMEFEDKTDDDGSMYLRFHSVEQTGIAQPPYLTYTGK